MINRLETIFCHAANRKNPLSDGEGGIALCFSNYDANAKAWCHDGGGMAREVVPRDLLAQMGDGELQCSQARKSLQPFCGEFLVLENVPMSLDGQNHHAQGS
jgi:hypothetical protein